MKTKLKPYAVRLIADDRPAAVPTNAQYDQERDELVVTFSDLKVARVPVSKIPELAEATELDYADLDATPSGVCLMNDRIDMAVAGSWFYQQAQ
jgi:hypothetical protein